MFLIPCESTLPFDWEGKSKQYGKDGKSAQINLWQVTLLHLHRWYNLASEKF